MAELVIAYAEGVPPLPPELEALLRRLGAAALEAEGLAGARADLTVVGDGEIRELNRRFRGRDAATDVLSFPLWSPEDLARWRAGRSLPGAPPGALHLGDVVIDLEEARRAAERYGHGLARELGFLLVHGLLHLMGYDHATPAEEARMHGRAEELLARFGLRRGGGPGAVEGAAGAGFPGPGGAPAGDGAGARGGGNP